MRAAIFTGVGEPLVVEDVTVEPPRPSDVVVRIDGSGVCHTEAAILHGHLPVPAPAILGHEVSGIVVEVGSAVTRVAVGDRVISAGIPACGNCFHCVRSETHLCEQTFLRPAVTRASSTVSMT